MLGRSMIILPLLSFGAIYALIPIIIIIILIAAAAGLSRGTDLFALLGFGTLVEAASGIGKGGGGIGFGVGGGKGISSQNLYKPSGKVTSGLLGGATTPLAPSGSQTGSATSSSSTSTTSSGGTVTSSSGNTSTGTTVGGTTSSSYSVSGGSSLSTSGTYTGGNTIYTGVAIGGSTSGNASAYTSSGINTVKMAVAEKAPGKFTPFSRSYARQNLSNYRNLASWEAKWDIKGIESKSFKVQGVMNKLNEAKLEIKMTGLKPFIQRRAEMAWAGAKSAKNATSFYLGKGKNSYAGAWRTSPKTAKPRIKEKMGKV